MKAPKGSIVNAVLPQPGTARHVVGMFLPNALLKALAQVKPESSMASVIRETEIFLIMDETIDLDKERERLQKEIERLERNIMGSEKKLSNKGFVDKAPEKVVAYEREKLESMKESLEKVKANLENLG